MFFVLQPLYVFNAYFAKFSLLLLYLRIWPAADSRNHKFRLLCKAIGVFTFLAGISTLLAVIFACHPITVGKAFANLSVHGIPLLTLRVTQRCGSQIALVEPALIA